MILVKSPQGIPIFPACQLRLIHMPPEMTISELPCRRVIEESGIDFGQGVLFLSLYQTYTHMTQDHGRTWRHKNSQFHHFRLSPVLILCFSFLCIERSNRLLLSSSLLGLSATDLGGRDVLLGLLRTTNSADTGDCSFSQVGTVSVLSGAACDALVDPVREFGK